MNVVKKQQGNALAKQLIEEYWSTLTTGAGGYWDLHDWPFHYTPCDQWASREQWIKVARECLRSEGRQLFAMGLLLDEGFTEHLDTAIAFVTKWEQEWEAFQADCLEYIAEQKYRPLEPEDVYSLIKHFPHDNRMRREWLSPDDPEALYEEGRRALISVEDKVFCRNLGARIESVFDASKFDASEVEDYALPRMAELGRLCSKYINPSVMNSAKQFCLEYLERDREMAPRFRRLIEHITDDAPRILWIRDRIAPLAWRIGWLDILTSLRGEQWYWNSEMWNLGGEYDISFIDGENLLVWSQYVDNDLLRERALHKMSGQPHERMEGAISWVRMSNARWPPG